MIDVFVRILRPPNASGVDKKALAKLVRFKPEIWAKFQDLKEKEELLERGLNTDRFRT